MLGEKAQQVSVLIWLMLCVCVTALKHAVYAVYLCEVHTWEFWMCILLGEMAWAMTWPWGVTNVTGWYTAPPGGPTNQTKNKQ